jgi:hypothetical protein
MDNRRGSYKAYMSDRHKRETLPVWTAKGGYLSPDAYVAERLLLADRAEREARAILAVSEPEPTHAEMVTWGGRPARIYTTLEAMRRTAGASPYSLRDELADALRAFVGEGQ